MAWIRHPDRILSPLSITMIDDPLFYLAALPAVFLVGLSKGGFGGSISLLGIPLMSLVISPIQAAAIMLPILIAMDIVGLLSYRRHFDAGILRIMLPGALMGILVGYLTAAWVTADHVKLIVGVIALLFTLNHWFRSAGRVPSRQKNVAGGLFWGALSGFTSFVSHAGGPPYQMYTLPRQMDKQLFAGTSTVFFASVNAAKLAPYFFLGQFNGQNLATSAMLLPLAPVATLIGVWAVKTVSQDAFYRVTYMAVFVVSLKLIWDGLTSLSAGA